MTSALATLQQEIVTDKVAKSELSPRYREILERLGDDQKVDAAEVTAVLEELGKEFGDGPISKNIVVPSPSAETTVCEDVAYLLRRKRTFADLEASKKATAEVTKLDEEREKIVAEKKRLKEKHLDPLTQKILAIDERKAEALRIQSRSSVLGGRLWEEAPAWVHQRRREISAAIRENAALIERLEELIPARERQLERAQDDLARLQRALRSPGGNPEERKGFGQQAEAAKQLIVAVTRQIDEMNTDLHAKREQSTVLTSRMEKLQAIVRERALPLPIDLVEDGQ